MGVTFDKLLSIPLLHKHKVVDISDISTSYLKLDGSNANTTIDIQGQDLVNVGNLGVGTDSPVARLQINTASSTSSGLTIKTTDDNSTKNIFEIKDSSDAVVFGAKYNPTGGLKIGFGADVPYTLNSDAGVVYSNTNTTQQAFRVEGANSALLYWRFLSTYDTGVANYNNLSVQNSLVPGTPGYAKIIVSDASTYRPLVLQNTAGQSGNVGIGLIGPLAKLHIQSQADQKQLIIQGHTTQTANLTEWQNSSGTALSVVDASGRVGIGTAVTTGTTLTVKGSNTDNLINLINPSNESLMLLTYNSSGGIWATGANKNLDFRTSTTSGKTLSFATFPGAFTQFKNSSDFTTLRSDNNRNITIGHNVTAGGALTVQSYATTTVTEVIKAIASQTANLTEWQNSSGTALSVVDESGNLGIGTASPTTPLDMYKVGSGSSSKGAVFRDNVSPTFAANADNLLTVRGTGSSNYIWRGRITTGGDGVAFLMGEYGSMAWLGAHNAALDAWEDIYINPDGAKKTFIGDSGTVVYPPVPILTIDNSSGRVGIGTSSPSNKLHIITTAVSDGILIENKSVNDVGNVVFRGITSRDISFDAFSGSFRVVSEPNGGGGGYVLFTVDGSAPIFNSSEINFKVGGFDSGFGASATHLALYSNSSTVARMLLDSTGRVGIATGTPQGRLHVKGSSDEIQQITQANTTQTANLTEWQNSSSVVQASIDPNGGLLTGGQRVKSIETSTTTATMSDDVEIHICNGTSDYILTLPTPVTGKVIQIINKNTATVTLSGTISSISATSVLYSGESIDLVYDGSSWS